MLKKLCAMLLAAMLAAMLTVAAGAMTGDEVLQAVEASKTEYAPGSPLTRKDFTVFSSEDDLSGFDNDLLAVLESKGSVGVSFYANTPENLVPEDYEGFAYTYRGVSLDDRTVDPALFSRDGVMARYGVGVGGKFDPESDVFYQFASENDVRNAYGRSYVEIMEQSVDYMLYSFEDVGQIMFYFDAEGMLCDVVYYAGIRAFADKEAVKQAQEFLNAHGYECGTPDGVAGAKTRAALEKLQQDQGMYVNGLVDDEVVKYMWANY